MILTRVLFKGWGENEFGRPNGLWLTEEQVKKLVKFQYDPDVCDKPLRMGGRWVIPKNFLGEDSEAGKRDLKDLVRSSATFGTDDLKGLAEAGYLSEVRKAVLGTGFRGFVDKLVSSGQYELAEPEKVKQLDGGNSDGRKRYKELREKFLGNG